MNTKTYNGWCDKATWACNLWLANDEGLYREIEELKLDLIETLSDKEGILSEEAKEELAIELAKQIETYVLSLKSDFPSLAMFEEFNPENVDFEEIAKEWVG